MLGSGLPPKSKNLARRFRSLGANLQYPRILIRNPLKSTSTKDCVAMLSLRFDGTGQDAVRDLDYQA